LCAFAGAIAARVKRHRRASAWLSRLAGVFLIGFGIRLIRN
jgi:threonine/homoserine/homoserine lactone efflux protein